LTGGLLTLLFAERVPPPLLLVAHPFFGPDLERDAKYAPQDPLVRLKRTYTVKGQ
jgi:hypothetical protein